MKNGISSLEERFNGKPLIDFGYVLTHPECVNLIWERYNVDLIFKYEVDRRLLSNNPIDEYFKVSFYKYFGDLLENTRGRH